MTFTRRLAAGLPALGVSAFAVLAFTGAPAAAAGTGLTAAAPVLRAAGCAEDTRIKCEGYGYDDEEGATDETEEGPGDETEAGDETEENGDEAEDTDGSGGMDEVDDERGNPGYGGVSPTTAPTPSATINTVPPTTSPTTSPATTAPAAGPAGGVSPDEATLPLTGSQAGVTLGVGALLIAGGAAIVWYTRRRRNA
ncbi:LPXTG cell wall anchor domain-containing protein [Mangrovihabitans endophyticus]|uniref:Gram-positive cocci surface proteins LPxTG domain-containing protein n=1 Tax=Mangrovihabitans endophyticus TaxID=1751298 RepID=A0A8J3C3Z9_9ACTN|nr:LPXTG cell wall anchor domain-containing protein [Mangrovihabitans endophyticus]GGL06500.1 hypothetical protein GCM10012284_45970 [Mangrovihabitans endophyticus]